ncbi:uncharacterized protein BYT42DRAFT_649329 [Radiomyces spectabilis]|uniref:uncharacterized protein n=1 Tax=Radiomyces spectabilis TaxID=64574 RepID=UPI002220CEE4|nr:uncharacterized protein BYT42DRAFT_649329 [Radiomyces spectabilis]KAI8364661.1 hypothetical protein BYT42DRAFT_649329 [Radiomyces spectabilis]
MSYNIQYAQIFYPGGPRPPPLPPPQQEQQQQLWPVDTTGHRRRRRGGRRQRRRQRTSWFTFGSRPSSNVSVIPVRSSVPTASSVPAAVSLPDPTRPVRFSVPSIAGLQIDSVPAADFVHKHAKQETLFTLWVDSSENPTTQANDKIGHLWYNKCSKETCSSDRYKADPQSTSTTDPHKPDPSE